ncbi:Transcription factor bHLH148 [Ananas comosus]|uniref:Transcription factor bHLH148 n=1 Tax=Ananas comosus TaxID=4615 RepID=A0A199VIK8_ANACO|nr:Transcription factor bHLH148 [Ananas comosus]
MAISNPESGVEASRKRRREGEGEGEGESAPSPSAWRSERAQKLYSSKLLEALRRVRRNTAAAAAPPPRSRLVREAADRALAVAARGRTRWSRAILAKARAAPRRLAASARRPEIGGVAAASGAAALRRRRRMRRGTGGKERVLGRLVPGGRRLSFPKLIEEASDYIAALEMQVRAMSALARVLSALGPDRPGSSEPDRTGSSEPA